MCWFTTSTTPRVSKRLTAGEMNSSFKQALEIPRAFLLYVFSAAASLDLRCPAADELPGRDW